MSKSRRAVIEVENNKFLIKKFLQKCPTKAYYCPQNSRVHLYKMGSDVTYANCNESRLSSVRVTVPAKECGNSKEVMITSVGFSTDFLLLQGLPWKQFDRICQIESWCCCLCQAKTSQGARNGGRILLVFFEAFIICARCVNDENIFSKRWTTLGELSQSNERRNHQMDWSVARPKW